MVRVTFIGGPGDGDVRYTTWGNDQTPCVLKFEVNKPVEIDPEQGKNEPERAFLRLVIAKARKNRFFKVEDVLILDEDVTLPADVVHTLIEPSLPKRGPGRPPKVKTEAA